jgi:hypothetical protein
VLYRSLEANSGNILFLKNAFDLLSDEYLIEDPVQTNERTMFGFGLITKSKRSFLLLPDLANGASNREVVGLFKVPFFRLRVADLTSG